VKHNPIVLVAGLLFKIWFMLYFTITLVILFPAFFILLQSKSTYPACFKLMRFWGWMLTIGAGVIVQIKGKKHRNLKAPYIICANHASYLDIILTYCVVPDYFIFMGKKEIDKVPLFNIFFKGMNVLVDRKNKVDAHRAFLKMGAAIDDGVSVAIFPEGTISKDAPRLKPFKNGLFKLAIDKQVPILPVTFLDNFRLMEDRPFLQSIFRPGIARVIIHEPVLVSGLSDNDLLSLREQVRVIIEKPLKDEY
jgi:1-acyl-sn-glycerol-3-phosphate acyltransferase